MEKLPKLSATAPAWKFKVPPWELNSITIAFETVPEEDVFWTLPVISDVGKEFVTTNRLVIGLNCADGLETLYKYWPARFCAKSPFWKFSGTTICPGVELMSPGMKLVTVTVVAPLVNVLACPAVS